MFGNHLSSEATDQHPNSEQVENILLPRLISLNCANFDINECNFSERIMNAKDKNGLSREGSGRVAINKDAKIRLIHCYTLESNYHNGRRVNQLAPKINKATGQIEPETPVTDITSKIYTGQPGTVGPQPPPFTFEILLDVGHALCAAILDLVELNNCSRIPQTTYKSLSHIQQDLEINLQRYENGAMLPPADRFKNTTNRLAAAAQQTRKAGALTSATNK